MSWFALLILEALGAMGLSKLMFSNGVNLISKTAFVVLVVMMLITAFMAWAEDHG